MGFRKDFVWGVATAAYQIEGAADKDGKGLSIWDVFANTPGKISDGSTGATACDSYHRYLEDVQLIQAVGAQAYRFSISWPRVLPQGVGRVNPAGLDYYDRLVDALLAQGVEPYITLYHWDLPYALYQKGGWLNRDSSDWFAEYTRVVVEKLSDRVKYWMTFNEPQVFITFGYVDCTHAPGLKLPWRDLLRIGHHVMLAHGKSVMAIRSFSKQKPIVGYAPTGTVAVPNSESPSDIEAARRTMFEPITKDYMSSLAMLIDPVILGKYPDTASRVYQNDLPEITADDLKTIHQPLDFLGYNIYTGEKVKMGSNGNPEKVVNELGIPQTAMGWNVTPEALYWGPKFLWERYQLPFYITENGMANLDWASIDGKVHDAQRIDYLQRYLSQYKKLANEGADLRGYFQWSLLDNFEWAFGYSRRFGLVHVDFETQQRTVKDSGYWYQRVAESNGEII